MWGLRYWANSFWSKRFWANGAVIEPTGQGNSLIGGMISSLKLTRQSFSVVVKFDSGGQGLEGKVSNSFAITSNLNDIGETVTVTINDNKGVS